MFVARLMSPNLIIALILVLTSVMSLGTAYTYAWTSGLFPRLVGWVFLVLALCELAIQIKAIMQGHEKAVGSAPVVSKYQNGLVDEKPSAVKEFKAFGWLGGVLVSLYLLGFMISTPLYVFVFLWVSGKRSLPFSAAIAAGATIFVYIVFLRLLEYKLYPGMLLMQFVL